MPSAVYAQCSGPAGPEGRIEYFSATEHVFKYCDGTDWVAWGGGAGNIWSDSGSGYIEYTSTLGGVLIAPITGASPPQGAIGSAGGGGGTPSGAGNGEIQFNSNGAFESTADLYYDSANEQLIMTNVSSGGGFLMQDSDAGTPDDLVEIYNWTGHGRIKINDSNGVTRFDMRGTAGDNELDSIFIDYSNDRNVVVNSGDDIADATFEVSNEGVTTWPIFMLSSDDSTPGDIMYVSTNGFVGIGDTTPDVALDVVGDINYTGVIVDVSDIRMKYDIEPLDSPLRKLSSLNGFSFKMKDDPKGTTEYGVSAQDVQKVFPELVHQVEADGTLGVSYNGLVAPMIEAIKELKAENEMLRARLDILEQQQKQNNGEQ